MRVVRLPRHWYVACLSEELRSGVLARTVLDQPLALFRDGSRRPVAVLDRCPHRNVPLSLGRRVGGQLQCRYHGWRFDGAGRCVEVPGLLDEPADRAARRVDTFPTAEQDGFVWVVPDGEHRPPAGEPFRFPGCEGPGYATVRRRVRLRATLHAALENTLDVPHTAFLHGGLFRGGRSPADVEVVVRQGPDRVEAEYLGEPRPEGLVARLLAPQGGVVTHVDRFVLPSLAQVEYRMGDSHLVVTSAFTPVTELETELHAAVTFRLPVGPAALALAKLVVTPLAGRIVSQDAAILRHQSDTVRRFGGEQFASTPLDVMGQQVWRMLQRAARGEAGGGDGPVEQRVRMRV